MPRHRWQGTADLVGVLQQVTQRGYDGAVMLELYRSNYEHPEVLWSSMQQIKADFDRAQGKPLAF